MVTQDLLYQYKSIKKEIEDLDQRIVDIYQVSLFPKSSKITNMPRPSGYFNDGMNRLFEKIEELADLYLTKRAELVDQCMEIEKSIDDLKSVERRLLRYRYIDGMPWADISKLMGYSIVQLHRIQKNIFTETKR